MKFDDYYTSIGLAEETSIDKLNDLQDKLDDLQVYSYEQGGRFFHFYYKLGKNKEQRRDHLDPLIDSSKTIFSDSLDQDRQIDFKSNARSFVRIYNCSIVTIAI